jgi:hypothetical protein
MEENGKNAAVNWSIFSGMWCTENKTVLEINCVYNEGRVPNYIDFNEMLHIRTNNIDCLANFVPGSWSIEFINVRKINL